MKLFSLIIFTTAVGLGECLAQDRAEPIITTEFEFPCSRIHTSSTWETPVTTFNGSVYGVYLDPDRLVTVARRDSEGTVTSTVVSQFPARYDLHHTFSIGVDSEGYIHIVGNQHNLPSNEQDGDPHGGNYWRYWVSANPEDVSAWEFIEDASSRSIGGGTVAQASYVKFARNPTTGSLFSVFRANSGLYGFGHGGPGKYGAYVARYSAADKTWSLLGGKAGESETMWAFEHAGVNETVYQPIQPDMFVDGNGGIHIITGINHDNTSRSGPDTGSTDGYRSGTAVLYGFSDDDGDTWKKADGSALTLPNTVAEGDVAHFITPGEIHNTLRVAAKPDGTPYILYVESSQRYWTHWNGASWAAPYQIGDEHHNFMIDNAGVISFNNGTKIYRVRDGGASKISYSIPGADRNSKIDRDLRDEYLVRMMVYTNTADKVARVITLNFDPDAVEPPPVATLATLENTSVKLFPNPTHGDNLFLEVQPTVLPYRFEIVSNDGQVLRQSEWINQNAKEISTAGLEKGVMIMRLYSHSGDSTSIKLIKN